MDAGRSPSSELNIPLPLRGCQFSIDEAPDSAHLVGVLKAVDAREAGTVGHEDVGHQDVRVLYAPALHGHRGLRQWQRIDGELQRFANQRLNAARVFYCRC